MTVCAAAVLQTHSGLAQQADVQPTFVATAETALPDAPSSSSAWQASTTQASAAPAAAVSPQIAKQFATTIKEGQTAQPISAGDKLGIGFRQAFSLGTVGAALISAGYAHLADTRPHYGVDRAGFGERLGAAALKGASTSIFYYGVYSNVFHEDPRYYVLGSTHPFKKRVIYAASSVVITRKDSGGNTVNWALLSAVTSSSALANAYYPDRDRDIGRTATSVLTSLAIRAGTQQLREFSGEIRQVLHLKH